VIAIYARENGQGMAFPAPPHAADTGMGLNSPAAAGMPAPAGPVLSALRDVPRGGESEANRVVHLVTADDVGSDVTEIGDGRGDDPSDEPPRPPTSGGVRPSLKRVK
jgi:stringent starvation protein B